MVEMMRNYAVNYVAFAANGNDSSQGVNGSVNLSGQVRYGSSFSVCTRHAKNVILGSC